MKKLNTFTLIAVFIFVLLYTIVAFGQEQQTQYLLSGEKLKISGFGGPAVSFSQVQGNFAVLTGGGGAVLLNQTLFIGGFGEGLASDHRQGRLTVMNNDGSNSTFFDVKTDFDYGGFWLGYIHQPRKAVHFGLSAKVGWGEISLSENDYHIDRNDNIMTDAVFVFNPQAEIELNLYRWFKLNAGLGYRFVGGIDKTYLDSDGQGKNYFKNSDFTQPQFTIGLLFGGFGSK